MPAVTPREAQRNRPAVGTAVGTEGFLFLSGGGARFSWVEAVESSSSRRLSAFTSASNASIGNGHLRAARPEEARGAAERVMRAMGLAAIMPAEKIRATAARYADLMAASRAGHAMAAEDEKVLFGEKKRKRAGGGAEGGGDAEGDSSRFPSRSERDLELATLCEHHLLPFHGAVHVSYAVSGTTRQLTRGELQRIVTTHGRRLQVQERLTRQVCEALQQELESDDVAVIIDAKHMCVSSRGVGDESSSTVTADYRGAFRNAQTRSELLKLIRLGPS